MRADYGRGILKQMEEMEARMIEQIAQMEKKHAANVTKVENHYEELLRKSNERWEEKCEGYKKQAEESGNKVAELEEKVERLEEEIGRLKSKGKNNSGNSSLPPSTDEKPSRDKAANEYNGRKKSGKSSGGQTGHPGRTLRIDETEQRLREKGIEIQVEHVGKPGKEHKKRLVLDLNTSVTARELRFYPDKEGKYAIPSRYTGEVIYGDKIKALTVFLYGQGVTSLERIEEMLVCLSGQALRPSQGTISNWLKEFDRLSKPELNRLEETLLDAPVVHTDSTNVTTNGCQSYIRNFSTDEAVLYTAMPKRSHKALSEITFLKKYAGILIHDHETALYKYGVEHGECNVHILRYLRKNTEDTEHIWSGEMAAFLVRLNSMRKECILQGVRCFSPAQITDFEKQYDDILNKAGQESIEKPCRFQWASKAEQALLKRMQKYKANHLLFLHDFNVSFDNNMSERDLRKCKNRQKMSGGFRTQHGCSMYCGIMSVIETCKRKAVSIFDSLLNIFAQKPALI